MDGENLDVVEWVFFWGYNKSALFFSSCCEISSHYYLVNVVNDLLAVRLSKDIIIGVAGLEHTCEKKFR